MANQAPSILSISYDESLLRTREWLLRGQGFQVTSALGFTEAAAHCGNSAFDLVIIGHSIPQKDKMALISQVRVHNHTRILALRRHGEESLSGVDHSIQFAFVADGEHGMKVIQLFSPDEASQGPGELIAAVQAALAKK